MNNHVTSSFVIFYRNQTFWKVLLTTQDIYVWPRYVLLQWSVGLNILNCQIQGIIIFDQFLYATRCNFLWFGGHGGITSKNRFNKYGTFKFISRKIDCKNHCRIKTKGLERWATPSPLEWGDVRYREKVSWSGL